MSAANLRVGIVKGDYDAYGGPETLLSRLLPHLAAYGIDPVPVVLLRDGASALPARLSEAAGRSSITIPWTGPAGTPRVARRLAAVSAREGLCALHTNDMRSDLVAAVLSPFRPSLAWAAHVHGWLGATHRGVHRLYEGIDRWVVPRADLVLCGSRATRAELVAAGVRAPEVVPNAIALPDPPAPEAVAAVRARCAGGSVLVGVLGRVHPGKGQDLALAAIAALRREGADVALVVVGDGPFRAEIEAARSRLGLEDRVTVTGFVDDTTPWLAAMDIVVVPSRKESLPLVALEAMAMERPVVAAAVGDLPDVVAGVGVLVPPDDAAALAAALAPLVADPAARAALGRAARRRIEELYTVETMAGRLAALLRPLAARRGEPAAR